MGEGAINGRTVRWETSKARREKSSVESWFSWRINAINKREEDIVKRGKGKVRDSW